MKETHSFVVVPIVSTTRSSSPFSQLGVSTDVNDGTIISPFDNNNDGDDDENSNSVDPTATVTTATKIEGPLELTWENVELVLDEMRPFLIQDGGNVAIQEIDGPVVRLELQVRNRD
jgi:NifU-like domain